MAIYHFTTQPISRSDGRSVVACAAYRAGEKLKDDRLDKVHDYARKRDVAHTEILLPQGAPDWMQDRETLWNHVEQIEKRKDARLAREVQISLPRELTLEQNKELARVFVQQTFVDQGMVADLCIHMDRGSDGECQPHAHVLLSTREVTEKGFGLKNTLWDKKETLIDWRQAWSEIANHHLALHGHDIQIDHRSYADQAIDLEPQHKLGAVAAPEQQARLEDHQRIAYENGERLYQDPTIALDALTKQQSTFTPQDLARFVNRHTRDYEQFQKVYDKVQAAPELIRLGKDDRDRDRWTSQEMLTLETSMLEKAQELHQHHHHAVQEKTLDQAINKRTLTEEQQTALRSITASGDLKCVVGYAGTGKSYLLEAAREVWETSGYRVRGVSLSGIATQNLQQSSGIESRTVASQLYRWNRDQDKLTSKDILVIDEAGMLGSRQMERLIREAQQSGAKVVAVGDWQQLQAIEAGASFRALSEKYHYVELTNIRRQEIDWQRNATVDLAQGRVKEALNAYQGQGHLHTAFTQDQAKERLITHWHQDRCRHPHESQLIMAYTRQDVKDLNDMARMIRRQQGELGTDQSFDMERGPRDFAVGDRVYFLKRDQNMDVINGTLGTIKQMDGHRLQITIEATSTQDKPREWWVDTGHYKSLEHGYAATVYKAQGNTVDRSYLLTSSHYDAHATYVGMSRHRLSCEVFSSHEIFKNSQEMIYTLGRDRTKDVTLDYTQPSQDYARQRSIQPETQAPTLEQRFQQHASHYAHQAQLFLERVDRQEKEKFNKKATQFIAAFRQAHPRRAKEIEDTIRPESEKQALAYIGRWRDHQRDRRQSQPSPRLDERTRAFQDYTEQMAQSKAMMTYFQHRLPKMAQYINHTVKEAQQQREQERHLEYQRQKTYDYSRGFSR